MWASEGCGGREGCGGVRGWGEGRGGVRVGVSGMVGEGED